MDVAYFTQAAALAGLAVLIVQQILKLKLIPPTFANKYPVPTNIVLSIIASAIAVWKASGHPSSPWQWVLLAFLTSLVAAIAYNSLFKNWTELRNMESNVAPTDVK